MKNVPTEIYLLVGEDTPSDADFNELGEVTWCDKATESNAIKYIREDALTEFPRNEYQVKVAQMYIDAMGIRNLFFRWFHTSGELTSELCKFAGSDEEVEILEIMERIANVLMVVKNLSVAFDEVGIFLLENKQWLQLHHHLVTQEENKK